MGPNMDLIDLRGQKRRTQGGTLFAFRTKNLLPGWHGLAIGDPWDPMLSRILLFRPHGRPHASFHGAPWFPCYAMGSPMVPHGVLI